MKRWVFNLFCLVSLLIFAVATILFITSYIEGSFITHGSLEPDPSNDSQIISWTVHAATCGRGGVAFHRVRGVAAAQRPFQPGWYYGSGHITLDVWGSRQATKLAQWSLPGITFWYRLDRGSSGWHSHLELDLALWLFLPFGIPPVVWWRKRRKNRGRGFPVEEVVKADSGAGF